MKAAEARVEAQREHREVVAGGNLLEQMRRLQAETLAVLEEAKATHDLRIQLAAIEVARRNMELMAKLIGEMQTVEEQGGETLVIHIVRSDGANDRALPDPV